jgi:hypothetical protein
MEDFDETICFDTYTAFEGTAILPKMPENLDFIITEYCRYLAKLPKTKGWRFSPVK